MINQDLLLSSRKIRELQDLGRGRHHLLVEGLWDTPKAFIAAYLQKATGKNVLILTGESREEANLFHDLPLFTECPFVDFPAWETLPSENTPPSPDIVGERYLCLEKILKKSPHIVLTSLQASLQKLIPPKKFQELHLSLKVGGVCLYDELIQRLLEMGYQRRVVVSDKGEFAVRGGIIDLFAVSEPAPFRIEFWGDEIQHLRIFDPIGQRSVEAIESIEITAAQEFELLKGSEKLSHIIDYLGPETLIIFDELLSLEDRWANLKGMRTHESPHFSTIDQFLNLLEPFQKVFFTLNPIESLGEVHYLNREESLLSFDIFDKKFTAKRWISPLMTIENFLFPGQEPETDELILELGKEERKKEKWMIFSSSSKEESVFKNRLREAHIELPKSAEFHLGYLSSGFVLTDANLVLFPLTEITHRRKIRRQKLRSTFHISPSETYELEPGDLVVHLTYGIGKYIGLEKRPNVHGIVSEFFMIEYGEGAKVYVPIDQAHLLTKYVSTDRELPSLHILGSSRWKRTKELTQKAIVGYAEELIKMYAQRTVKGGFSFPEDSPDMQTFEEEFPFIETEDQLKAISEIKKDMSSSKSMDRLICGDVGYGKTEVAMRAAFKAAMDGKKQVAVLVPTTVLAMQHYETFSERMVNFPLNIAVLSRFQNTKQTKNALELVKSGGIDILIGTHRIISQDVQFKDLGLVIIDEEQRFGVRAKEHLKKIKVGVDCLTLSATPIPRTLYLSLMGARDLSVISTPPQDRLPIKTIVGELSDDLLKNALLRELVRDGQAFVIHNRVETIYEMASRIKKLIPHARIVVGHGQMEGHAIDAIFHSFKRGDADILVATSIIENGIDIPNANTILVDRADRFGLADLYQIRGRVGRWNRPAWAYLLVPKLNQIPELTRKRLLALTETSGQGGGFRLARLDLEIRGAGDTLGLEQSGHVQTVGFHQYCKWLKRAIASLQGDVSATLPDPKIDWMVDARLPELYVSEVSLRMELYQRYGDALTEEEVDALFREIQDRFGPPPPPAVWLYHLNRIRLFAKAHHISHLKIEKVSVTLEKQIGKNSLTKKVLLKRALKDPQEFSDWIFELIKSF